MLRHELSGFRHSAVHQQLVFFGSQFAHFARLKRFIQSQRPDLHTFQEKHFLADSLAHPLDLVEFAFRDLDSLDWGVGGRRNRAVDRYGAERISFRISLRL